jgi:WD40 repeat protein
LPSASPAPLLTPTPAPLTFGSAQMVELISTFDEETISALAWAPDGVTLAAGVLDGIALYDASEFTRLRQLEASGVVSLAFSSDGRYLAAGSRLGSESEGYYGSLSLWRGPAWEPLGVIWNSDHPVNSLAFSRSGRLLGAAFVSSVEAENSIEIWNTYSWEITKTLQTGSALEIAFSPDGKLLATAPDRYAVKVWQIRDRRRLLNLASSFTGAVNCLAFSPNGATLATGHYDGAIRIWDVSKGALLATMNAPGVIESLAFSPDGALLATGESYTGGAVRLWETTTGQLLRTLEGHTHGVDSLAFSPSGLLLASGSYDGELRLWGVPTAAP